MKNNVVNINKTSTTKKIKSKRHPDEFSPLDAAKFQSEMKTILGKPQTVGEAYNEIMNFDVNEALKKKI